MKKITEVLNGVPHLNEQDSDEIPAALYVSPLTTRLDMTIILRSVTKR